jgi:hypothetical protein
MQDPYLDRIMVMREIAQKIIDMCDRYKSAPGSATMNRLLAGVERMADLAEEIEVERTVKALDS